MKPELIIRILTIGSLAGLLLAVGLRLTFVQVADSVRRCRFGRILAVNFAAVPMLCALAAGWAGLDRDAAIAMVLLGAAPFAPVVPVFARMARADIALAAGLTSIYPVISAFLTPWVCGLLLMPATGSAGLHFASPQIMLVLVATITLPLLLGVGLNQVAPRFSQRWLRAVEVVSEAAGAFSLCFVTIVEFHSILALSLKSVLVMAALFELCLAAGYWLGHEPGSRRVTALGTSNRNIALALLVALQSFPNLHVVAAVVGNGLLLILLGLAHVGYWNLRDNLLKSRMP
jgi:bile acid:Na+ symporter, BASS family